MTGNLYSGTNRGARYRWMCNDCGEVHDCLDFSCECQVRREADDEPFVLPPAPLPPVLSLRQTIGLSLAVAGFLWMLVVAGWWLEHA